MIHVIVRERDATAQATEPITSGSVGLECSFRFSEDWEGLGKVAIFQGSGQIIDVALVGQESCAVPHEVLQQALGHLKIGVYGTGDQGQRVTPTVWADAGRILPGVEPSEIEPTPATQSLVQQILEAAENAEEIAQGVRDDADAGEFDGADGVSPSVSVTDITGGHRVTIVDAQGTHVFDVMNGEKGDPGSGGDNVFWATYNSTTEAEITAAVTAGKTVLCKISDEIFYLVNKAAIGPSGSAWLFASANQTSMRVTFVSGSYWNSIGTRTIPTKTSDLSNDSGFVNASGAAAAAPVQSVNGQTGAVTVGGAAYFPFTISEGTVTPGTGVTPQAIYQAYTDGKAVFAVIEPELEIDDEQILPLEWINELPSTYSIWFSVVYGNVNFDLIYSVGRWHTQTRRLYEKPQTGIPKFDLASDVQASLGKADTALQSFTETDPTVPSWAKASSKPSYTASEVGAIAAPASPSTGDFLCWNGSAWAATTLAAWQGGNY